MSWRYTNFECGLNWNITELNWVFFDWVVLDLSSAEYLSNLREQVNGTTEG